MFLFGSRALQNAVAEGDTRTISMHHIHTDEDITITYKRDGRYDEAALEKLNWFLRDWRRGQETRMDPHLIDLVWEVQRETNSKEPIWVVCGYRSPETNAMLRHRSSGVARFSQHMLGHAMDFYIPGVPLAELRAFGLRLQRGGVGFYPTSGSPFVHMDTGSIRMWPRMTRQELVRVFPDGRTVHIPTDGRPLAGYALALADIAKRGSVPSGNSLAAARSAGVDVSAVASNDQPKVNPFAKLLGLAKKDGDDEEADSAASADEVSPASAAAKPHLRPSMVAAVERGVQKVEHSVQKKVAAARADVAKLKLIRTAAASSLPESAQSLARPAPSAHPVAADTPNQVIMQRGYWQGPPESAPAVEPVAPSATLASAAVPSPRRTELASADPDATGALIPFSHTAEDHVPAELALSYAEQPDQKPASTTPIVQITGPSGTTIAAKGLVGRTATAIHNARAKLAAVIKVGVNYENPWVRAIVMSPSVRRFLTTVALGASDFRSLASLMLKPTSSVLMTFSSDPNPGLDHDRFSGSAIVFISTVTYPTQTAALQ